MARLLSVNVGLPRDIEWKGRTVHTGIWKNPVRGRCRLAAGCLLTAVCWSDRLGNGEVAIGAVRNHHLARLKMELRAIEMHRDDVRFERH